MPQRQTPRTRSEKARPGNTQANSSLAPARKLAYIPRVTQLIAAGPMENVVLIIHLLLALGLIAVVLMQRSEGGGLGMGGGGGAMTGRAAATALSKVTWILAAAFIVTSITLTIIAAQKSAGSSIIDRLGVPAPAESSEGVTPSVPSGDSLLPPAEGDNAPLVPRAD